MVKLVEQIPIESYFHGKFITYKALDRIVQTEFANSNADKVNIFIDLYQFLTPPTGPVRINDFFVACSIVINYAGHLRNFFRKYYKTESKIILVASNGMYKKSVKLLAGYNKYYNKRFADAGDSYNKMIESNLSLLHLLCPYLPDIYFKAGSVDATIMIKHMLDHNYFGGDRTANLVISTSHYMYQLPSTNPEVVVARQSRKFAEDNSYSYNSITCLNAFLYESRKFVPEFPINPKFISMLMILNGIQRLGVKSKVSLPTALDIINGLISGIEHDCNALYNGFCDYYLANPKKKCSMGQQEFVDRFMAIDINYQYLVYESMSESKLDDYLKRKQDPDAVKEINNKYFKNNPIILEDL